MSDEWDFKVEDQLVPADWTTAYTAAQQEKRTFSLDTGDTDSRCRIKELRLTKDYLGELKDLFVFKPGTSTSMFRFPNYTLDNELVLNNCAVMMNQSIDSSDTNITAVVQDYLDERSGTALVVEIILDKIDADTDQIFFKTNELFKIVDTTYGTGLNTVFKVLEISYDFTTAWEVRVSGTNKPHQINSMMPPQIEKRIQTLKKAGKDTYDLELELNMAKDKLKAGLFKMAQTYLDTVKARVQKIGG